MAVDTEAAMVALFALLDGISVTLKTKSRRLLFVEDMPANDLPAVFQNQIARADNLGLNELYAADFDVEWYVYAMQPNQDKPSTPILNPVVDAAINCLPPNGGKITLSNGSTVAVFRSGPTHYFEGLLGQKAVARIPIRLRVPKS